MRKLYSFILAVILLSGGIAFAYDDGGLTHKVEGSGASTADPVRVYMLVRYPEKLASANFLALSAGDCVVWDVVSDDGVTINRITSAQSRDAVAGIIVGALSADINCSGDSAAADIGRSNWGYMQTFGLCTTAKTSAAVLPGQNITASTVAGYVLGIENQLPTLGATRLGFAYDTAAAGASVEVFLDNR